MPASDATDRPLAGSGPSPPAIPDHTLLARIGQGAYGEVWLARNSLGTLRAVKIVRRADFDDDRPYEREFAGIRRFEPISRTHEGLVDLLQVGRNEPEGWFYYVMELADSIRSQEPAVGSQEKNPESSAAELLNSVFCLLPPETYSPHTLASEVKAHGALPLDASLRIARTLASALAELHRHGLVHRDIKPSNIIFVAGVPKLADIGLVAAATEARSFVGTEGFIPPEGPGTPRADLYSLGIVLYVLSTGQSHRDFPEPPADLATRPDRERWLEWQAVIHRACQADPRDRYASAAELLTDLDRLAAGRSVRRHRAWRQRRRFGLACAVAATVLFIGWFGISRLSLSPRPSAAVATPAGIFILPFRNDGANGNHPELRGRMTDAFINSLKQLPGLTVAQRRSALRKLPLAEARAEAARLFGVRYVLEGALGASNGLSLNLTLHETGRDRPAWTQRFTGDTNRLIELETQAIHTLAAALSVPVPPEASQRIGGVLSNNLAAWRLVEAGVRDFFLQTRTGLDSALHRYNEAIELDSEYQEAWLHKAGLYRELVTDDRPHRVWPEVKACATRMLAIDPTSEAGQYFLWITQFIYEWDWLGSQATFHERRARGVDGPVVRALYLRMLGRFDEARLEQAKVEQLDQKDPYVRNHTMAALFVERQFSRVLEEADRTDALLELPGIASGWRFHAYYQLGDFQQALEAIRTSRKLRDSPPGMALEACALAKLGQRDAALKLLDKLEAMPGYGRYVDPYPLAWVHLALGDKQAALTKLRQACLDRSEWVVFTDEPGGLRTDPKLDELRDEPEFQELLTLAGLDVWPIPAKKPGLR